MPEWVEIPVPGCRPTPMASYLKGLAVIRLAGQANHLLRAAWHGESLVLASDGLGIGEILSFFLNTYAPTPAVSPWNGGSGFFPRDRDDALRYIENSETARLEPYRRAIQAARDALRAMDLHAKPDAKKEKPVLLRLCRATFPDEALSWLDACTVFNSEDPLYMPLLGSGGNDGRLDFTNNFMRQVVRCLDPERRGESAANLRQALFDESDGPLSYSDASLGQFYPGAVGGPGSSSVNYEGASTVNPWDYVLALEGAMAFAGSVSRRLGSTVAKRQGAFPFTVSASAVGTSPLSDDDATKARAEVWLPLWKRPASWAEVQFLLSEGRVQWGRRQARNGVEFAEAVVNLGVDRGIEAFARHALLQRNGRSYLAVHVDRVRVETFEGAEVLQDPEYRRWVERFQEAVSDSRATAAWRTAWHRLQAAIYQACIGGGQPDQNRLQKVLLALGQAAEVVATRPNRQGIPPLSLDAHWLMECADDSSEWRLAVALAHIGAAGKVPAMRAHVESVKNESPTHWVWEDHSPATAWAGGVPLARNLAAILARRVLLTRNAGLSSIPLQSQSPASISDVHRFLTGELDDVRLADLFRSVVLIQRPEPAPHGGTSASESPVPANLSRAYALLKQVFWPGPVVNELSLLPPSDVLPRLGAHDIHAALRSVTRHLQAHQVRVRFSGSDPGFVVSGSVAERMAAAMLLPVPRSRKLQDLVLRGPVSAISEAQ